MYYKPGQLVIALKLTLTKWSVWTNTLKSENTFCKFRLFQMSCQSIRAGISRDWILLSDSAKWQATLTHPCTALTQRNLNSQIFESRTICVLNKCMIRAPKLISENKLHGPKSFERNCNRENVESSSYEETAMKSGINCQSKPSLQFSSIDS